MTYETVQGDTFDIIAKKFYGNERRMDRLLQANLQHIGVVAFPAGITLTIPEIEEAETQTDGIPPWRKST